MSVFHKLATLMNFSGRLRPHSTPGGIHPEAYKKRSLRSRIMPTPIPELLVLPLKQHQGSAAKALVTVGEQVRKYQKLAEASSANSAPVHAPTSGVIVAIENASVIPRLYNSEHKQLCIHLRSDGEDSSIELSPVSDYHSLSQTQLQQKITEAGICGMGGAGYPTSQKLRLSIDSDIEVLIINAAECEPYITADEALIRERASEVVLGAEILQAAALATRCVIAIEKNKVDAVIELTAALKHSSIDLMVLESRYPAGSEKQLIQAVTAKQVPAGLRPADIGIQLQNTGTAYAVYKAIILGQPCISRITTLTGLALLTPKNFETLLGLPISFLFKLCGLNESAHTKTIAGGSMMGVEIPDDAAPVSKTTNCLIAGSAEEFPALPAERACIRCGFCAAACPANLLPQQLLSYSKSQNQQQLQEHGLFDCIECGACAYVCPSNIPLVQYYRASKTDITDREASREQSVKWQDRFQYHQYRIKKAMDEALDKKPKASPVADTETDAEDFSRSEARQKIADAVARVQARKSKLIASTKNTDTGNTSGVND